MVVSPLTNAPADIILSIASYFDHDTLLSVRLTSHTLNALLTPLALQNISIAIDRSEDHVKRMLRSASEPLPALYLNARHLTIRTNGWYISRWVTRPQIDEVYKMIEGMNLLTSFRIAWEPGHDDNHLTTMFVHEIQEGMVQAVLKATGGRLRNLVVEPWRQKKGYELNLPQGLLKFRGLKSLKCILDQCGSRCAVMGPGGVAMPWIDRGQLHRSACIPRSYGVDIQHMLQNNPHLEHLSILQGCAVRFHDAETLLASNGERPLTLRTLSIKGITFPFSLGGRHSPFSQLQELEVLSTYSLLPLDNLWTSLLAARTKLKKLITHQASLPLVTYLSSYSGARELVIADIEDLPQCASYAIPELFFTETLPQHSSSLTSLTVSLHINHDFLEGWSFSPSLWMPTLAKLRALKSLALFPGDEKRFRFFQYDGSELGHSSLDIARPEIDEDYTEEQMIVDRWQLAVTRNYREALRHVALLPQLESLSIMWPDHVFGSGRGRSAWYNWCRWQLSEVATRLRSNTGNPSVLKMLSGTYDAKWSSMRGNWEYIPREQFRVGMPTGLRLEDIAMYIFRRSSS